MNSEDNTQPQKAPRNDDSVAVKTPFGSFDASGNNVITIMIVAAAIAICAYLFKDHVNDTRAILEELKVVSYVVSLPQEKRDALNLNMPEALRQRAR